jgi:hypothetical protein
MKEASAVAQAFLITRLAHLERTAWTAPHGVHVTLVALCTLGRVHSHPTVL